MDTIRIGAVSRNYFNLPLWIAVHRGMFAAENINPEVHLIEGIAEVDQRLDNLDLDIALSVTENVILCRERGGDLRVLGGNVNRLPFSFITRHWFYTNRQGSSAIALAEMGIEARYANRAWDEFVRDEIFPRDGAASIKAIETLIDVSALIRAIPSRSIIRAQDYIDHSYLDKARQSLA